MGEGLSMGVVHKVNGMILDDYQYQEHLRSCRAKNKAAGTDVFSRRPIGRNSNKSGWPLYSDALAVWPSQVREAEEHARKIGVPTEFDPKTGKCVLTDRAHRARYLRANGVCDKDGGYKET